MRKIREFLVERLPANKGRKTEQNVGIDAEPSEAISKTVQQERSNPGYEPTSSPASVDFPRRETVPGSPGDVEAAQHDA
jgi:hypothetical protein